MKRASVQWGNLTPVPSLHFSIRTFHPEGAAERSQHTLIAFWRYPGLSLCRRYIAAEACKYRAFVIVFL